MIVDYAQYQAGIRISEPSTVADAAVLAKQGPGFVLLALSEPDAEELTELAATFDLPPLAVEDGLEGHQRPKLEDHGDCLFVVVKSVDYDEATMHIDIGELDIFLGSTYAIVVARSASEIIHAMRARLDEHSQVGALGPMAALWALLDAVIDDGERVVDLLSDHGERIEQSVFEGDLDQSEAIYLHRRRADHLIRSVHPALPILDTLERGEPVASPHALRPFLRDVGDHARMLTEALTQLSSRLDGLLNANLARVTVRQNVIVQKVSAWAAIAAAPTIIAGIYGMNFRYFPELGWLFGYPLAIVIMVVAVVVLRWHFRRIGWL
ncbi:MAG TPA: CorA family divalent cation transporter [Acidimicrobiia bacterium]|nr:CorA family divalent cation transporter [Acidimicrobiia bacterium]